MSTSPYSEHRWTECRVSNAVPRTITWINEAVSLSWGRDNRPLVKTHFIGSFDTVQIIWNKVKSVAALYAAVVACTRDERSPFPTRDDLAMAFAPPNWVLIATLNYSPRQCDILSRAILSCSSHAS